MLPWVSKAKRAILMLRPSFHSHQCLFLWASLEEHTMWTHQSDRTNLGGRRDNHRQNSKRLSSHDHGYNHECCLRLWKATGEIQFIFTQPTQSPVTFPANLEKYRTGSQYCVKNSDGKEDQEVTTGRTLMDLYLGFPNTVTNTVLSLKSH